MSDLNTFPVIPRATSGHSATKLPSPRSAGSSMQLTRAADYAVRVMVHLASMPSSCRSLLPDLAHATGAPGSFLSKVLQLLCRAGFVDSRRGHSGGFLILPPGRAASIADIIEAIEGPFCLNVCMDPSGGCTRKSFCPAHPVWVRAQKALLAVLRAQSIAELAAMLKPEANSQDQLHAS